MRHLERLVLVILSYEPHKEHETLGAMTWLQQLSHIFPGLKHLELDYPRGSHEIDKAVTRHRAFGWDKLQTLKLNLKGHLVLLDSCRKLEALDIRTNIIELDWIGTDMLASVKSFRYLRMLNMEGHRNMMSSWDVLFSSMPNIEILILDKRPIPGSIADYDILKLREWYWSIPRHLPKLISLIGVAALFGGGSITPPDGRQLQYISFPDGRILKRFYKSWLVLQKGSDNWREAMGRSFFELEQPKFISPRRSEYEVWESSETGEIIDPNW